MDNKELHNLWLEGYNDGFRRAIEFVKKQSGHGDVELDRFLEELVEEMMNDWYKSCPDD